MARLISMVLSVALAAITLAGCGGDAGSSGGSGGGTGGIKITPGGGKGATAPPIAPRSVQRLIPPAGAPAHSVRVPVLTYHRVAPLKPGAPPITVDLTVDPANFAAELATLHDHGYHTVTQSRLFDALYRGGSLPSKPILISVDDGYVDDVTRILPELKRWHMVATFFVITGRFTMPGFLTADQVRQLDAAGMDVGDHTASHVDLRLASAERLQAETSGSRRALQRTLGHFVYAFAYPFGAHNDAVVSAVRKAGFTLAYTTAGGVTESTTAPLTMPRLHIGRAQTPGGLLSLLGGA
jgi:peptidoglycan/xylan/chitin deacetylase (PgdA/CDA1 family)